MVMDPTFLSGLPPGPDGERVKEFIAGACGVVCLELEVVLGAITGQVTRQDGEPVAAERLIFVRSVPPLAFSVTAGTLVVDGAEDGLVVRTTALGAFGVSAVVALPPAVAILYPDGGESRVLSIG